MMDFDFDEKTANALDQLAKFMDAHIYPNEKEYYEKFNAQEDRWQIPPMMEELKKKANEAGLWNLFLPHSDAGPGFSNLKYAPLCEQMGRVGF
ncbi:MAG: acyl-CoA dehydrogenase family protein, partial [Myxococcota bacterium]|nr:acyl-CoA dehydrogenase family protein [Myxococcota bacterium]